LSTSRGVTPPARAESARPSPQLGALDLDAVWAFGGGEGFERDQAGGDLVAGRILAAGGEDRRLVRAMAGLGADEGDDVTANDSLNLIFTPRENLRDDANLETAGGGVLRPPHGCCVTARSYICYTPHPWKRASPIR
jgi:hypothetical protein